MRPFRDCCRGDGCESKARRGNKWARPDSEGANLRVSQISNKNGRSEEGSADTKERFANRGIIRCRCSIVSALTRALQACSLTWDRSSKTQLDKSTGFQVLERGQEDSNHTAIREQLLEQALAKMTQDIQVLVNCARALPIHDF